MGGLTKLAVSSAGDCANLKRTKRKISIFIQAILSTEDACSSTHPLELSEQRPLRYRGSISIQQASRGEFITKNDSDMSTSRKLFHWSIFRRKGVCVLLSAAVSRCCFPILTDHYCGVRYSKRGGGSQQQVHSSLMHALGSAIMPTPISHQTPPKTGG